MSQVVEGLLAKLNIPPEEIMTFTKQIKERRMGELFKHFKAYDIQAARMELQQEREEVQQEREGARGVTARNAESVGR